MQSAGACSNLSRRVRALPASPIRALLNAHRGPDTLDLGGGIPEPALFPSAALRDASLRVLSQSSDFALQYGPTEGHLGLREWISARLKLRGFEVSKEQILITHGSQHALATAASAILSEGDLALLEQPVYPGALQAFSVTEARLGVLPVTEEGWDLSGTLTPTPKAVYVIAQHQNPTGRCASAAMRAELATLARHQEFYVLEDDAYGELDFAGRLSRPLIADCPSQGLLLGSFSKTLCPGLRLGYLVAPVALIEPLVRLLQMNALQPNTFTQQMAFQLLTHFDYEAHLGAVRRLYQARAFDLSARLREVKLEHRTPTGGFFLWVKAGENASNLAKIAALRGLLAVPESAFQVPGFGKADHHLRMAFSRYVDNAAAQTKLRAVFGGPDVL